MSNEELRKLRDTWIAEGKDPNTELWRITGGYLPKHEHKFVIPVEWVYSGRSQTPARGGMGGITYIPDRKKVVKLRCECGEEASRIATKEGETV